MTASVKRLEYYYGRRLQSVEVAEDGTWTVLLDGGARIKNHDTSIRQPSIPADVLSNLFFAVTILEETKTQLVLRDSRESFGHDEWRIVLNPVQYSIIDNDEEYFPQHPVERQPHPTPPHPDERIAEGPTSSGDA